MYTLSNVGTYIYGSLPIYKTLRTKTGTVISVPRFGDYR